MDQLTRARSGLRPWLGSIGTLCLALGAVACAARGTAPAASPAASSSAASPAASTSPASPPLSSAPARGEARRTPAGPVRHVLLISMDGLLPEVYLHPEAHGLRIPFLRALAARGASSDGVLSAYPTLTYPSHTSMVTGVWPAQHGIVSNQTFDPLEDDLQGWRWYAEDIRRDPVWRIAERAGYEAALIHWPVSVGARVHWLVPEYWRAKNSQDKKLLRSLSTPGLLETVAGEYPDFWARYQPPASRDDALTDIAIHVLTTAKPELTLVHLVEVDAAQHKHGVFSPEASAAIENDDRQLGRLLEAIERAGIARDTVVIVASDHGFMNAERMVKPCTLLRDAGLVELRQDKVVGWKASTLVNSGHAYVYVRDPGDAASRIVAHEAFEAKSRLAGSGIGRLYEPAEIRARGGDPEASFAVEAEPGFQFGGGCSGAYVAPPAYRATHGYDPERPELHASLILAGPTIAHGTISGARLVDIGPTVAALLGLSMPEVEGAPVHVVPAP